MSQMTDSRPVYREEQRFQQWWLWLLVGVLTAVGWWLFIQQIILKHPFGENPLPDVGAWIVWALIGLGLPWLLWGIRMVTAVDESAVVILYRPFVRRVIPLASIREASLRVYSPIREYGGWGVKGWSRRNMAYNVSGNRGVQLVLEDGRKVMIGSQRPDELIHAIQEGTEGARAR